METHGPEQEMRTAHEAIGGFIARCSLLDYRVSQFMARWFCTHDKQKFLSYTLKAMPLKEKRQIIEERLALWHRDPEELRNVIAEISSVIERRNLVARGVLSRRKSGKLCIKSFSGARFISDEGAIDIIDIDELASLSERARELSERVIALGLGLTDAAG